MVLDQHWFTVPLATTISAAIVLALIGWRRWNTPGAPALTMLMLAVVEWGIGYLAELQAPTLAEKLLWAKIEYFGIVALPLAWFAFAYQVSEHRLKQPWRSIGLLAIIPVLTLLFMWTNEAHGLMYHRVELYRSGQFTVLDASYGMWFWIHSLYSYSLMLAGSIILLRHALRAQRLYRMQVSTLLLGIIVPWLGNIAYIFNLTPFPNLDITPITFTFTGAFFAYSMFRYRLLDLKPVARDALIEGMRDGVIVVDALHRVVDLNAAAWRILGRTDPSIIGLPLDQVLPVPTHMLSNCEQAKEHVAQISLGSGAQQRHFDLTVSPVRRARHKPSGHVLVLHDTTQRILAEAATRESEARYRTVSEMTSDYTYSFRVLDNRELQLEWVTDAFTPITGFTVRELIDRGGWQALIHPDDLHLAYEFINGIVEGHSKEANFRIITKDGATRWLHSYGRPEWDAEHRQVIRLLAAGRDITARTEVLHALQESERRYRLLFESNPHPMWVYDQETLAFLAVNAAAIRHYGYSRDEFLRMTISDIRPAEEVPRLMEHIAREAKVSDRTGIWRHRKRDGTLIDVEITSHTINFYDRPAKVILAHDITERRRAEQALRQQNEYLAALHDTTLAMIHHLDADDVLEAIVLRAGALVGTEHGYIYLVERDEEANAEHLKVQVGVGIFRAYIGFRLQEGEGLSGKVWKTGQPFVVNNYDTWDGRATTFSFGTYSAGVGVPLTSQDRVIGTIGLSYLEPGRQFGENEIAILTRFAQLASIALDNARLYTTAQQEIAERKRAEADLALARDEALEAARLKSEFLAIMSHELRTPLNAIVGFTDLVQQQALGALNREQQHALERVARNAVHLRDMINDMLDLNKLDAGGMRLTQELLWLGEVIQSAFHSIEMVVQAKKLEVTIHPSPPNLPLLYGDAGRLRQIVLNLLSNAVKFTPEYGSIEVLTEYGDGADFRAAALPRDGVPTGCWAALSVRDSGIGIDAAEHERIWSEFYQVDSSTTRQYGGTGLGLAIVRRLTAKMEGKLGLHSELGRGSTFTVWIPAHNAETREPSIPNTTTALSVQAGTYAGDQS